jgi:hypothetical protein
MPDTPFESISDSTSDPFVAQLAALAPVVDHDASREFFERHRARPVTSRRWLLPAAAVTLLIAGVVGVWALAGDGESSTISVTPIETSTPIETTTPGGIEPGDLEPDGFEVLLTEWTSAPGGTIVTAVDESELEEALRPITGPHDDLDVDFESSIVAVFNVAGTACPLEFAGFDTSGDVWSPELRESGEECGDAGVTWAYVVAFDRSLFGSVATFAFPSFGGGVDAPGSDGFEVIAVEQTQLPFGTIRAAADAAAYAAMWSSDLFGKEPPSVDFVHRYVVTFTLPDDACPDTLLQIRDMIDEPLVWEPVFEPPPGGCDQPLVTRTYVVAIDRPPVDAAITFRLPGDDVYGYDGTELTATVAAATVTVQLGEAATASPATGDEFVVLAAEATQLEFGTILVAYNTEQFDRMWAESFVGADQPSVDFDHLVVVAFTLPDNPCPDTLTGFVIEPPTGEGPTVWEPQIQTSSGGCRAMLIARTFVVGIDRAALGFLVTFRLPGNDDFEFDTNTVTVKLGRLETDPAPTAPPPTLTPTGERVPLPPVGEPQIAVGTFGVLWVVHHDDGTVSVLDAVVDRRSDDDKGGVTRLGDLVAPTATGDGFSGAAYLWDSHGRTVNGPRTSDLTGFAGNVVGDEVDLFLSDAATIAGSADRITGEFQPPDLDAIPLLDLGTLPTLSFSGPIWRQLDATLVVENAVGMLCSIDQDVPAPDLATCDAGVPTAVRSTRPEITSWYFGPLLAEFDEFGRIVQVVPTGGQASRDDGPSGAGPDTDRGDTVAIQQITFDCDPPETAAVDVRLLPAVPNDPVMVLVQVIGGGTVSGETLVFLSDGSPATVRVEIDSGPVAADGMVVLRSPDDPDVVFDEAPTAGCT